MATDLWDASGFETSPAGNDQRSIVDDKIRQLKLAIRERLAQGGHYVLDATPPYSKDGRHVRGSFALYRADATTKMLDLPDDTHIDVTSGTTFRTASGAAIDFANAPLVQTSILNNACTRIAMSTISDYYGALSSGTNLALISGFTTGSPVGPVMLFVSGSVAQTTGAATGNFDVAIQVDRANNGTWAYVYSFTSPSQTALQTQGYRTFNLAYLDAGYAGNGSTVNYRARGTHVSGTDTYAFLNMALVALELRR